MVYSRPDIAYSVGVLSRHGLNYTDEHYEMATRVLRYLNTTKDEGLYFRRGKVVLSAYADAAYANCGETSRSTTGYVIQVNGTAIMWRSKRQGFVTLSTAESEVVAASEAGREVVWLRMILKELGFEQDGPTDLKEDNNACIVIATRPEGKGRTRHLNTKHHYVIECVEHGWINMVKCDTRNMVADMLTKPLDKILIKHFKELVNLIDITSSGGVLEPIGMSQVQHVTEPSRRT